MFLSWLFKRNKPKPSSVIPTNFANPVNFPIKPEESEINPIRYQLPQGLDHLPSLPLSAQPQSIAEGHKVCGLHTDVSLMQGLRTSNRAAVNSRLTELNLYRVNQKFAVFNENKNENGANPLSVAIQYYESSHLLEFLSQTFAYLSPYLKNHLITDKDRDGQTALHHAVRRGYYEVVCTFLAHAKDNQEKYSLITTPNYHGSTPLSWAEQGTSEGHAEIRRLFVEIQQQNGALSAQLPKADVGIQPSSQNLSLQPPHSVDAATSPFESGNNTPVPRVQWLYSKMFSRADASNSPVDSSSNTPTTQVRGKPGIAARGIFSSRSKDYVVMEERKEDPGTISLKREDSTHNITLSSHGSAVGLPLSARSR